MRIVRSDGSVIEGTAAEIAEFEALQRFHAPPHFRNEPQPALKSVEAVAPTQPEDWQFASTDVAFRCLTRRKLSEHQKSAIRLIYDGGDSWVRATEIQKHIGYDTSQFAGMMGAFGKRFVNTRGYVLDSAFFDQEWDDDTSCYRYRLPPTVRSAVEKARIPDFDL